MRCLTLICIGLWISSMRLCRGMWYTNSFNETYAPPNKNPHGPVSNARPLMNLTTAWQLVAMTIVTHYLPLLRQRNVIPLTKFALYRQSSAVDL